MSGELQVIEETYLTAEEQQQISLELDNLIDAQKNSRQSINKLVFECVTAMTVADDISKELADKKGISRFVGAITGSNKALQDKINTNRSVAQYASQVCLQKLAEQNLMSFDLITAVNNKLNASLIRTDEEFNKVYDTLTKFFKKNRSELVRIESRLEKVERNVNLLNWQNSIEYQEFNGVEYADLDAISKIVCLTRDFYDITQGNWSTSDLLLLKTAMSTIDIDPKAEVNYYEAIKMIADDEALKEKLLGDLKLYPVEDAEYLVAFSGLQKLAALNDEDSYIIDTIAEYAGDNNIAIDRENIEDIVASKYLANLAQVNIDVEIECFDLLLDLLYNLQNYEADYTDIAEYEVQNVRKSIEFVVEGSLVDNLDKIKKYAEKGNARALYLLGIYYSQYLNNEDEANNYFKISAEKGDLLGKIKSLKFEEIDDSLIDEIRSVVEKNDYYAYYELGNYYLETTDNAKKNEGVQLIKEASENNIFIAKARLGVLYDEGEIVKRDINKAIELYKSAADEGILGSILSLALCYGFGDGVEESYEKALELFFELDKYNFVSAQYFIGCYFYHGYGVKKDLYKAYEWWLKAANASDREAQYNLAHLYYYGEGVSKNIAEAIKWYTKAAEAGNAQAQYQLSELYFNGEGVALNYVEGLKWLKKAAEQGLTQAEYKLGYLYTHGDISGLNYSEAVKFLERAAEKDYAKAENELGECYLWGNGVKQGYAKAVELFEQAAEKNDTDALCNLGYCYQNGYGVKRNINKAKEYYQKAIDNGSEKAVDLMGKLVESNLENNKEAERIVINPYESKSLLDEFLDIFK